LPAAGQVVADMPPSPAIAGATARGDGVSAVAADVHAGAIAGGTAADDTVSDVATDVHTVTVAGGITRDIPPRHRTINVHARSVTGSITRDGAVAAVAQVAADIDAAAVSTVTLLRCVDRGALPADVLAAPLASGLAADDTVSDVAADVHTVTVAGGITRDVTSCHRTINVNTRSVTGGIARDGAVAAVGQVAAD